MYGVTGLRSDSISAYQQALNAVSDQEKKRINLGNAKVFEHYYKTIKFVVGKRRRSYRVALYMTKNRFGKFRRKIGEIRAQHLPF